MADSKPSLLPLYKAIAASHHRLELADLDGIVEYALEAGLGPLIRHYSAEAEAEGGKDLQVQLHVADMTTRLRSSKQFEALTELMAASERAIDIIALKGVSSAYRYYPSPEMRTMGDIDLLVRAEDQSRLEDLCLSLGYEKSSHLPKSFYIDHHHSMPLHHPEKGVWVEVHTALFPSVTPVAKEFVFCHRNLHAEVQARDGQHLHFLSPELELVYTCVHWASEPNWLKNAIRLVDIIYIINDKRHCLDWDKIHGWLEDSPCSAARVFLLIHFLYRLDLLDIPELVVKQLAFRQNQLNGVNTRAAEHFIKKYTLEGAEPRGMMNGPNLESIWSTLLDNPAGPWRNLLIDAPYRLLFPPSSPDRYRAGFQLARLKKVGRLLKNYFK